MSDVECRFFIPSENIPMVQLVSQDLVPTVPLSPDGSIPATWYGASGGLPPELYKTLDDHKTEWGACIYPAETVWFDALSDMGLQYAYPPDEY